MNQSGRTEEWLNRKSNDAGDSLRLGQGRVLLVIAPDEADGPQSQLVASFLSNLLARLFPVVRELDVYIPRDPKLTAHIPRWTASTLGRSIQLFFSALAPPTRCRVLSGLPTQQYDAVAQVGRLEGSTGTVFIGSIGWRVEISTEHPVGSGGRPNAIGAFASAAFGTGEIWKQLLAPYQERFPGVPLIPLRGTLVFSCFDYSHCAIGPNPELPDSIDLGRLTLVGLGAGGGATAFTLASIPHLRGDVLLIEPDEVTETGLNRAVCAAASDALTGRPKVDVISEVLGTNRGIGTRSLKMSFDEAVNRLQLPDLKRVVAAVHSRAARRSIQLETPEVLWDAAATETGEFYVWKVIFGQSQCLACRFADQDADPEQEKAVQLSQAIGLSVKSWLRKIRNNEPFTAAEVATIRSKIENGNELIDQPSVGQRFGDWEIEQCGKLQLPDPDDEIPIPFAPVLAGVLVAGEIVKLAAFTECALDSRY